MQGERVAVIEERAQLNDGTAVRAYFFAENGALEHVSEQRARRLPDGTTQTSETQVELTGPAPRATRQVNGVASDVSADDIAALQQRATDLVAAVRATSTPPSVP